MYISRMDRVPAKRSPGPRMHGDVLAFQSREHAERIFGRAVERGVAVDGADAEEVEGWVVGGEEDGEGVLFIS